MQAISYQDSSGTLGVLEQYDAEEGQSSETSWLHVAWRPAESWKPLLQHRTSEDVSSQWPDHERAEPDVVAAVSLVTLANQYIEDHYAENLSLERMADTLGTDALHLGKLVKDVTGMNFSDHLASLRVEKAKNLLLNPNYYFIEIVSELGFESLGEFNRAFTKVVGEPPHAYRARLPGGLGLPGTGT